LQPRKTEHVLEAWSLLQVLKIHTLGEKNTFHIVLPGTAAEPTSSTQSNRKKIRYLLQNTGKTEEQAK